MRRTCLLVLVATALVACPLFVAGQQIVVTSKADGSPQTPTEADKKLKEIMSPKDGVMKLAELVPALEKFIRDYPDYPRLNSVYSNLMSAGASTIPPERLVALADEAMAKYPTDVNLRRSATRAKMQALKAQKRDDAVKELVRKLFETETDPAVLQNAAQADPEDGPKLLEKAIAERKKNPTGMPTLGDLTWAYAQGLIRAGRKDEGIKLVQDALDQTTKDFADLQVPENDPRRMRMSSRYQDAAKLFADVGNYDKALECVKLAEQNGDPTEGTAQYNNVRADIYAKMGKPDLELEAYAAAFAASMDPATRDKIRAAAVKSGRKPEEIFERARKIRSANAQAFKAFELKTMDGEMIALDSLKSKAILVNFFFPT